ncbi:MAG TPA: hypothetical protein VGG27_03810 [Magnetospirillaceae bacterium]|jgi:hypothetical protein
MTPTELKIAVAPIKQNVAQYCNQMIREGRDPIAVLAAMLETAGDIGINLIGREGTIDMLREMVRQTKRVQRVGQFGELDVG